MATKASVKARNKRKKVLYRVFTIIIVSVMAGGILLATMITRIY